MTVSQRTTPFERRGHPDRRRRSSSRRKRHRSRTRAILMAAASANAMPPRLPDTAEWPGSGDMVTARDHWPKPHSPGSRRSTAGASPPGPSAPSRTRSPFTSRSPTETCSLRNRYQSASVKTLHSQKSAWQAPRTKAADRASCPRDDLRAGVPMSPRREPERQAATGGSSCKRENRGYVPCSRSANAICEIETRVCPFVKRDRCSAIVQCGRVNRCHCLRGAI